MLTHHEMMMKTRFIWVPNIKREIMVVFSSKINRSQTQQCTLCQRVLCSTLLDFAQLCSSLLEFAQLCSILLDFALLCLTLLNLTRLCSSSHTLPNRVRILAQSAMLYCYYLHISPFFADQPFIILVSTYLFIYLEIAEEHK